MKHKTILAVETILEADKKFLMRLAILCPDAVLFTKNYDNVDAKIVDLYRQNKKIIAIKMYREESGVDLRTAKEYCDNLAKKS